MTDQARQQLPRLLFSVEEAAESLGISRTTLYELIKAGRLCPVHIGRATRFPVDELERYVTSLSAPAKRGPTSRSKRARERQANNSQAALFDVSHPHPAA